MPGLIRNCPHAYEYPLVDRDPIPQWTFGRVTLMGDAAHPMYPIGSNGASQAILDARVLTREILAHGPTNAALQAYEAERRPATTDLVMLNRRNGPEQVMQLVEERAPDGFNVVTDVLSLKELEDIAANYKRVAGFQVEGLNAKPPIVASACAGLGELRDSYSPSPCAITLRITFGSASSASVAIATQRMPSGARARAALRGIDHKLQRKMREHMGDHARLAMPARDALQHGRLLQRRFVVLRGEPVRARHFGHAAEQAFFGTGADQKLIAARDDESRAAPQLAGFLRRLARKRLLIAARARRATLVERAQRAGRLLRRADRGAQIHQRLRAIAGA